MLYIVPTPIGNLADITLRALETLKTVDVVFAEDTRRSKTLLSHFLIDKPLIRYNENDPHSVSHCLNMAMHKNCALVCDGGTPCISDPGWKLVKECLSKGIKVVPLPGPSALTCALSGAGITGGAFTFLGFMPRKTGKISKLIAAAYELEKPIVIYESPYRIVKLLEIISGVLGPQTPIIAARELTKVYEEWLRGPVSEIIAALNKKNKILGEFVLIIDRPAKEENDEDADF
ncbi:Uroporphyrin-III C/tetrapyrrole (corrin/porphyrin) methyltransferase [Elusimicrobium minutum Pei191]|uniref:Ribosomal RNA small subunit methyltransferase I n=1 Tax=Elusimicrobium minutum (strain Pei191) TaxID=445932 RepID=B2KCE7_ELUMP|nr:16S rRNA (cytidine(1402)-2'-O)-methyltransferase [Elusimicrobium minutum]ACC98068.1 Uroporphyrin-III C/tetrapyrrole (corrin/porphyrin) methyltransferase [Elusimicrobium minutum Pei191]